MGTETYLITQKKLDECNERRKKLQEQLNECNREKRRLETEQRLDADLKAKELVGKYYRERNISGTITYYYVYDWVARDISGELVHLYNTVIVSNSNIGCCDKLRKHLDTSWRCRVTEITKEKYEAVRSFVKNIKETVLEIENAN